MVDALREHITDAFVVAVSTYVSNVVFCWLSTRQPTRNVVGFEVSTLEESIVQPLFRFLSCHVETHLDTSVD
jgi:hypothetical protein